MWHPCELRGILDRRDFYQSLDKLCCVLRHIAYNLSHLYFRHRHDDFLDLNLRYFDYLFNHLHRWYFDYLFNKLRLNPWHLSYRFVEYGSRNLPNYLLVMDLRNVDKALHDLHVGNRYHPVHSLHNRAGNNALHFLNLDARYWSYDLLVVNLGRFNKSLVDMQVRHLHRSVDVFNLWHFNGSLDHLRDYPRHLAQHLLHVYPRNRSDDFLNLHTWDFN